MKKWTNEQIHNWAPELISKFTNGQIDQLTNDQMIKWSLQPNLS